MVTVSGHPLPLKLQPGPARVADKDRAYDNRRIKKAAEAMIIDCAAREQELQAADPDLLFEQLGGAAPPGPPTGGWSG